MSTPSNPVRFWAKADRSGGPAACWPWLAQRDRYGYGRVKYQKASLKAHRLAYTLEVGPIPTGLELDHLCLNKACVNPSHLEPVTKAENMRRTMQTHCKWGHPFNEENTYHWSGHGLRARVCRACNRARSARYKARQKARAA